MEHPKEFYYSIENRSTAEFRERGSLFIASAFPVENTDQCRLLLKESRKAHPKATHHCFAWRIGPDGHAFRVNDDGEPSGTAGRPILGQIDARELTNVMIIVVRYFGGNLLGTAGLIKAYKQAAALALQLVPVIRKAVEATFILQFDYTKLHEVMHELKQSKAIIIEQDLQLFCRMKIRLAKTMVEIFKTKLAEIRDVAMSQEET